MTGQIKTCQACASESELRSLIIGSDLRVLVETSESKTHHKRAFVEPITAGKALPEKKICDACVRRHDLLIIRWVQFWRGAGSDNLLRCIVIDFKLVEISDTQRTGMHIRFSVKGVENLVAREWSDLIMFRVWLPLIRFEGCISVSRTLWIDKADGVENLIRSAVETFTIRF